MPPLFDDLRASPDWPRSLAAASGGSPNLAQLSAALDDLRATIEGDNAPPPPSVPVATQAAAISALGESIATRARSGELAATRDELAAVNAWVRVRLLDCVDALARQREATEAREATLRSLFVAAGIVVVEFDQQFRFRWVYDRTGPAMSGSIIGRPSGRWPIRSVPRWWRSR